MKPGERKELKSKIEAELQSNRLRIDDLVVLTQPISPENAIGRVSRMDAINNKSINEAALVQAKDKQKKLEYAFSKIDDAKFGICVRCEQSIPIGRLMLMPQSARCVRCAR